MSQLPEVTVNQRAGGLPRRIIDYAEAVPEATPLCAGALLHLGSRAAVSKALARLTRAGRLERVCRGVYMRLMKTRFGWVSARLDEAIPALAEFWGETFVSTGGTAANWLRLTTQVPMREVYLTAGPDRRLHLGGLEVEIRHGQSWQLAAGGKAGELIRALGFLGRWEVEDGLDAVLPTLSKEERDELFAVREELPQWMAEAVSARMDRARHRLGAADRAFGGSAIPSRW